MRDLKLYIIGALTVLTVYLVAQYNKPAPIDWRVNLRYDSKTPYGNYILFNRLNDIYPGAKVNRINQSPYDVFSDSLTEAGNYIILTRTISLSKVDTKAMLKYISAGNTVFMSALNFEGYLADSLKLNTGYEFDKKNPSVNFNNPAVKQPKDVITEKFINTQYFAGFDTARANVITSNNFRHATYLRYRFGKGSLLVMANPQMLTNFNLVKPQGLKYAETALSYLPAAKHVYWDQYHNGDIAVDESPMRVFFQHPALQWAYYISLAALVLFVLYEIKRRQRAIPVIEPLQNATVGFVSVVGKVYYEQRDNTDIALKKITYFLEHLRDRYNLKTNTFDNEFLNTFIRKTGIEETFGYELINHMRYVAQQTKVSDAELITFNQLIEKFYIQTGSYGK